MEDHITRFVATSRGGEHLIVDNRLGEMVKWRDDNWAKWLGGERVNGRDAFGRFGKGQIGKRAK